MDEKLEQINQDIKTRFLIIFLFTMTSLIALFLFRSHNIHSAIV